jgi:6-pyruvoyltetrahydropterin/6-carboxytetrahydropterin synthase
MFRLTREVRFAINAVPDGQLAHRPSNSYGGFPSLTGLGHYLTLQVTLAGDLDPDSQYLRNIKEIDQAVREWAVPRLEAMVRTAAREGTRLAGPGVLLALFDLLRGAWTGATVHALRLSLSPFLAYSVLATEHPMVRLSQKFEFSATHRLHNPALSEAANRETFGKCNNPHGHGHNYEVQVTLAGKPAESGLLVDVPKFERVVQETVIDRLDHKNLNVEVPEFRDAKLIPSVENIAMTIYRMLKPKLAGNDARLASVTVWETPKTWCEYSE